MSAEQGHKDRVEELQKEIPEELRTLPAHQEDIQKGGFPVEWHPTPNGYFIASLGPYRAAGQTPEEAHDSLFEQYHGNKKPRERTYPHDEVIEEEAV